MSLIKKEEKTVYVLTGDGCPSYGSALYLLGVFEDQKSAKQYAAGLPYYTKIIKTKLNAFEPLVKNAEFDEWGNSNYLGGYIE